MNNGIDREFVSMSENIVRSLKHFGERLETAVSAGTLSSRAAEKIRANVMEGISVSMLTTGTLVKVPAEPAAK